MDATLPGAFGAQRSAMPRTTKACRPGAPVAGAKSRGDRDVGPSGPTRWEPRGDGDNKARSLRGEHEIDRNTIVQGMPVQRLNLW